MHEVVIHLEIQDLRAWQKHYMRTAPGVRRMRWVMTAVLGVMSLHFALSSPAPHIGYRLLWFSWIFLPALLFVYIIRWVFARLAEEKACRDGGRHGVLGEHIITLTPEYVEERTTVNEMKSSWKGIFRIDDTEEYLFILIQPTMAHVIPRRAFPSPAEADGFLKAARRYHETAQAAP